MILSVLSWRNMETYVYLSWSIHTRHFFLGWWKFHNSAYTKHCIVDFRSMIFMVCKWYLYKKWKTKQKSKDARKLFSSQRHKWCSLVYSRVDVKGGIASVSASQYSICQWLAPMSQPLCHPLHKTFLHGICWVPILALWQALW